MSLKEQLLQDMKASMKEKDTLRKDVIQIVRAGVLQIEKDNKIELGDEGVIEVIVREIKKRKDTLPDYKRSGRQDLIDDIERQINLLTEYLPQQLTEEELMQVIQAAIEMVSGEAGGAALSIKDMGKVMQIVTPQVAGRADNKLVSELVKKKLQV